MIRKRKRLVVVIVLLFFLFPVSEIYKDGGTRTYTSLTYKVIIWNRLDGKRGVEIYFFPNNFKSLSEYEK